jgi:prepilin-type N-terminal cleavage/methylation domain-containing protein
MAHVKQWNLGRYDGIARSARGFTLLEMLVVVALIMIVSGVAAAITPGVIRAVKGNSATMQAKAFLDRVREVAVTKRRNIDVRFLAPNQLQAEERQVPGAPVDPARFNETITFEGGLQYLTFPGVPDTPDLFGGMATPISLGGAPVVMFTSEGTFADINGDFINATVAFGTVGNPLSANAVTILGTTAKVRQWRWSGTQWKSY